VPTLARAVLLADGRIATIAMTHEGDIFDGTWTQTVALLDGEVAGKPFVARTKSFQSPAIQFSPDGRWMLAEGADALSLHAVPRGAASWKPAVARVPAGRAAFVPGAGVAVFAGDQAMGRLHGQTRLHDVPSGELRRSWEWQPFRLDATAHELVDVAWGSALDLATGAARKVGVSKKVSAGAVHPGARLLAQLLASGEIVVSDLEGGKAVWRANVFGKIVDGGLAFARDATVLAAWSRGAERAAIVRLRRG
jgi:hypothetical protein